MSDKHQNIGFKIRKIPGDPFPWKAEFIARDGKPLPKELANGVATFSRRGVIKFARKLRNHTLARRDGGWEIIE